MNNYTCFSDMISQKTKNVHKVRQHQSPSEKRSLSDMMQAFQVFPHGNYTLSYANNQQLRGNNKQKFQNMENPLEQWMDEKVKNKPIELKSHEKTSRIRKNSQSNKENNYMQQPQDCTHIKYGQKNGTFNLIKNNSSNKIVKKKSPSKNIKELCEKFATSKNDNQDKLVWKFSSKQSNKANILDKEEKNSIFRKQISDDKIGVKLANFASPTTKNKNQTKEQKEQSSFGGGEESEIYILGSVERKINSQINQAKQKTLNKMEVKKQAYQNKKQELRHARIMDNQQDQYSSKEKQVVKSNNSQPQRTLVSISKPAMSITAQQAQEKQKNQEFPIYLPPVNGKNLENHMSNLITSKQLGEMDNYNQKPSIEENKKNLCQYSEQQEKVSLNKILLKNSGQDHKKLKITLSPNYRDYENEKNPSNININTFSSKESIKKQQMEPQQKQECGNMLKSNKSSSALNIGMHKSIKASLPKSINKEGESFQFELDF